MLPQPTNSTAALGRMAMAPMTGIWRSAPEGIAPMIGTGDGPGASIVGDGPRIGIGDGPSVMGDGPMSAAPRRPRGGGGPPIGSSSPDEGVIQSHDPAAPPAAPTGPVPEGASTDDRGRIIPGQYRGDGPQVGIATGDGPRQAPVAQSGGMIPRRSGRRHMMHGGGGMMGAPSIQSLSRLFGGFGQGGY